MKQVTSLTLTLSDGTEIKFVPATDCKKVTEVTVTMSDGRTMTFRPPPTK